jgi:hypothetical protein
MAFDLRQTPVAETCEPDTKRRLNSIQGREEPFSLDRDKLGKESATQSSAFRHAAAMAIGLRATDAAL